MAIAVPFQAFIFNALNFPNPYFSDLLHFIVFTFISIVCLAFCFAIGRTAVFILEKRLPAESEQYLRLSIAIFISLLATALLSYGLLQFYQNYAWFNFSINQTNFVWSYIVLGITGIFLTFLMEGISHYTKWKDNYNETQQLNAAYKRSQLNGLKSQINPHFLFNSLNSLSSLIQEDEAQAEIFLNEMSKVYRYMLRNDDEQLVTLDSELRFLSSYMHILQARYGDGLQLFINVAEIDKQQLLAPLTLQVLLENAFTQNIVSKSSPLIVDISVSASSLVVKHNIQHKSVTSVIDFEAGLDNLGGKYELLGKPIVVNDTDTSFRSITIPLLENKEEVEP